MDNNFSRYISPRVESLAIHFMQILAQKIGYENITKDESKRLVNAYDIRTAIDKIKKHSRLRYQGKFGSINQQLQQRLNLQLALCDVSNSSTATKKVLIKKTITESDELLKRQKRLIAEQNFMVNLVRDIDCNDAKFRQFLRKVDSLYIIRENSLRIAIADDRESQDAIEKLKDIFSKHIQKAIDLLKEKSAAIN